MNEKKVYIAGPMTGRERVEYIQHFRRAEEYLEDRGYTVINPANLTVALPELSHAEYMTICLAVLSLCDSIFMLKGWRNSLGASMEYGYAMGKGIEIMVEASGDSQDGME